MRCSVTLLREAVSASSSSFAFSGCGWLTPYHLGVINALRETGHLTKDSLVAGSSGGAIAATLAASDGCTSQAMEIIKDLATDKEFNKDKAVGIRNVMLKFLPSTDTYLQCNNRLHVTVTQVSPKFIKRALVISEYKSNEDLAAAVSASCYIPMWSNIGVSTDFRDTKAIDGGVFAFMPPVGKITVTPFPRLYSLIHRKKRKTASISPNLLPLGDQIHSELKLAFWGLNPPSRSVLESLFTYGYRCGMVWGESDDSDAVVASGQ